MMSFLEEVFSELSLKNKLELAKRRRGRTLQEKGTAHEKYGAKKAHARPVQGTEVLDGSSRKGEHM